MGGREVARHFEKLRPSSRFLEYLCQFLSDFESISLEMTARVRRISLHGHREEKNPPLGSTHQKPTICGAWSRSFMDGQFFVSKRYLPLLAPSIHLLPSSTTPLDPSSAMSIASEPFTYNFQKVGFWVIDLTPLEELTF
jgi:hypothetical protein